MTPLLWTVAALYFTVGMCDRGSLFTSWLDVKDRKRAEDASGVLTCPFNDQRISY
jgi:hypothetical protein